MPSCVATGYGYCWRDIQGYRRQASARSELDLVVTDEARKPIYLIEIEARQVK